MLTADQAATDAAILASFAELPRTRENISRFSVAKKMVKTMHSIDKLMRKINKMHGRPLDTELDLITLQPVAH